MLYFKQKFGSTSSGSSILNKLDATVAPTVNDDSGDGYSVGSLWIDVTANEAYRCVDATEGAAIWLNTTVEIADLGDIVTHDADEFAGADHNHDEDYSALGHNHDDDYANKVVPDEYGSDGYLVELDENGDLVQSDKQTSELAEKIITEIDGSSALTLTVAQCSGTIINNYGQGAEDVEHQLPDAIEGLSFISVCGTTQAGNTWGFKAGTNDKIYLDGEAGSDNGVVEVTPAIGNFATWFTYKTGEGTYDWMCQSGQGTWGVPA